MAAVLPAPRRRLREREDRLQIRLLGRILRRQRLDSKASSNRLGGIDYEPATEKLYVSVPGSPGIIAKFNKNGTPANFSALNNGAGRDYIDLGIRRSGEISVDTSSNPVDEGQHLPAVGRHLLRLPPERTADRTGLPQNKFGGGIQPGIEPIGGCGATSGPNGEFWDFTQGNGQPEIHRRNLDTFKAEVTYLTENTFGSPHMCNLKLDSQGNFYGLNEEGSFGPQAAVKLPPEPVVDGAGGTVARPPERERRYRLNASCCGQELNSGNSGQHFGVDRSDDDVFLVESHVRSARIQQRIPRLAL